jgi:peptidoglycan/LPS O-acetylase OafA/YrhL
MKYRRDIEGLRAVAVIPVVLFHAGAPAFGGGFVGVDVFFVISGYLIASLILDEQQNGRFTIAAFYERRARRILPALFAVLAFTLGAGWFLMTPAHYRSLAITAAAAALFVANVRIWWQSGYFDAGIGTRPLLHTWSLAVEEQFYLLFPLYLWAARRYFPRLLKPVTGVLLLGSLLLSAILTRTEPPAAFLLAPTRIWELMLGVLLALDTVPPTGSKTLAGWLGALGLALIGVSVFFFSDATPYPGVAALVPTVGAVLLIWSGQTDSATARALQWAPLVFIGQISYSLYLWHFLLLEFARYVTLDRLSAIQTCVLLALATGLAILSWRFIEQPFRNRAFLRRTQVFALASSTAVALATIGAVVFATNGFPGRLDARSAIDAAAGDDVDPDREACLVAASLPPDRMAFCRIGMEAGTPRFILWGDSIGESMRPAFDRAAQQAKSPGVFAGSYGCVPTYGVEREDDPSCARANTRILNFVLSTSVLHTVVLAADWNAWADGRGTTRGGRAGDSISLAIAARPQSKAASGDVLSYGLSALIDRLRAVGKDVWLIGPLPEIGYDVPRALFVQDRGFSRNVTLALSVAELDRRQDGAVALLRKIEQARRAHVIWIEPYFCSTSACAVTRNGRPIYSDGFHLSRFGTQFLAPALTPIFRAGLSSG